MKGAGWVWGRVGKGREGTGTGSWRDLEAILQLLQHVRSPSSFSSFFFFFFLLLLSLTLKAGGFICGTEYLPCVHGDSTGVRLSSDSEEMCG